MKRPALSIIVCALAACAASSASAFGFFGADNTKALKEAVMVEAGLEDANDVTIIKSHHGAFNVSWVASVPNGDHYVCAADDMMRNAHCKKVQPAATPIAATDNGADTSTRAPAP